VRRLHKPNYPTALHRYNWGCVEIDRGIRKL
jgi:hypothetical protein